MSAIDPEGVAQLLDYRRRVAELYADVRAAGDPAAAHERWRATRRELYSRHPQSPVPAGERGAYDGPHYCECDPAWRLRASIEPLPPQVLELPSSDGATMRFTRFGRARAG